MVPAGSGVRRLTVTECERLQGFEDGYTAVPFRGRMAADGNRYKALGNSFAVPVVRWIGERIQLVSEGSGS
jgi:DNA (cytosine-5)-methyltransferase 1